MKKALIVAGIFFLVIIAYFVKSGLDFYRGIYKKQPGSGKTSILPEKKTVFNILVLGYGGPGHDGPYLTDSIMIVQMDTEKNKLSLVSLPRDLWVKLPTKSKEDFHLKVNSLYQLGLFPTEFPDVDTKTYPDISLAKKGIQDITGLTIDNYVTVDFDGFIKGIDILGGVDVDVQHTFDDYEYPIDGKENELCDRQEDFEKVKKFMEPGFDEEEKKKLFEEKPELKKFFEDITDNPKDAFPCRYEHLHFDKGMTHMDGKTALKYVRSRHSLQDGTDFGRAARQQQFVTAVKDKVISLGILTKVVPLLDELKNHIKTDVTVDGMKTFMGEAKDAGSYRIVNVRMSNQDVLKESYSDYGGYILIPRLGEDKWSEVHTVIKNGINEVKPTATPAPTRKVTPTPKVAKTK